MQEEDHRKPCNRGYDFFCPGCRRGSVISKHRNKIPTQVLCRDCRSALDSYWARIDSEEWVSINIDIPWMPSNLLKTDRGDIAKLLIEVLAAYGSTRNRSGSLIIPRTAPVHELCDAIASYVQLEKQRAIDATERVLIRISAGEAKVSDYNAIGQGNNNR